MSLADGTPETRQEAITLARLGIREALAGRTDAYARGDLRAVKAHEIFRSTLQEILDELEGNHCPLHDD